MKPTRLTLDTVAVPIAGGREFTAALYRAPDGEPEDLVLSVGFAADHNGWSICGKVRSTAPPLCAGEPCPIQRTQTP